MRLERLLMSIPSVKSRRRATLASLVSLCVATMGCQEGREVLPIEAPAPRSLRIGLIPEQNIFTQKKRYEPLAGYLSKKAGVQIELSILTRYGNILDNFVSNHLDGAFFGSFTGALALRKLGVEALARPEYPDGTSTYHGLLFVRKDSGIRSSKEMKGKRFAFVDKATTAGYLLPLYYLKTQGVDDYRSWLKESYFSGTHEGAIYDVLERKADVGAAKHPVFDRLASHDPRISEELLVLSRSPDVPENGLCVRSDLDPALKLRLRESLLEMDQDKEGREVLEKFGATRFIVTTEENYAAVFEFAATVGLDLDSYDYMNE